MTQPLISHTILSDGQVTLRPFRAEDAEELYAAVRESLPVLKPWMSWAQDGYSLKEARDFIALTRARWGEKSLYGFAITDPGSGDLLGGCSLSHIHSVYGFCNLGYWVRSARRAQGIAGRAAKLAARFAFEKVNLIRAEIVIAVGNEPSKRVAEKIGAHDEGILLNRMVVGKEIYDAHMFSLLPSDFGLVARL